MRSSVIKAFLAASGFALVAYSCESVDQPNPIAQDFPQEATGTLNGTMAVIPVPLKKIRKVIPSQWGILEHAYRDLLPHFPKNSYPLIMQGLHDHDIQVYAADFHLDDFSKAGFIFPFLDLLGDGHSSFAWSPAQMISADHPIALEGAASYGQEVIPSTFAPSCDAYTAAPRSRSTRFKGTGVGDVAGKYFDLEFSPCSDRERSPYTVEFFKNVTNQPMFFVEGGQCDLMVRYWDTPVTSGGFKPRMVKGDVKANISPMGKFEEKGVYGVQVDTAFVEYQPYECESLSGWDGTAQPPSRPAQKERRHGFPHVF